jgi:hypothetical protein
MSEHVGETNKLKMPKPRPAALAQFEDNRNDHPVEIFSYSSYDSTESRATISTDRVAAEKISGIR